MKYRILCVDGLSKAGLSELESSSDIEIECRDSITHEELLERIGDFDGLIVRSASKVSRDVIEAGEKLKLIARAGVGVDNIDLDAATERGIFVINAPSGNTLSTAELTMAMILALSRNIPQAARSMGEGKWDRKRFKGSEVAYKTLGIIGLGRVGREVANRAAAFRMKVIGFDPALSEEQLSTVGVKPLPIEEIFKTADFITVHTPLTQETENLIGLDEMKMMKPTARIINCARGGIVNEADLATALRDGIIAGAALDVYTKEPFDSSSFEGIDNCIMTPHLGASTVEAQDAVAREAAASVVKFFAEGIALAAVNLPASSQKAWSDYRPHILLAEKLGLLASQLLKIECERVTIYSSMSYPGLLPIAMLKGSCLTCMVSVLPS